MVTGLGVGGVGMAGGCCCGREIGIGAGCWWVAAEIRSFFSLVQRHGSVSAHVCLTSPLFYASSDLDFE